MSGLGLCCELDDGFWRYPPLWSMPTRRTCQAGAHPRCNAGHASVSVVSRGWYLVERLGLTSPDQSYQNASVFMDTAPTAELHSCNAPKAISLCSWFGPLTQPGILLRAEITWKSLKYFFISTCNHLHDDSHQIIKTAARTLLSEKARQLPLRLIQTAGLSLCEPGQPRVIWKR